MDRLPERAALVAAVLGRRRRGVVAIGLIRRVLRWLNCSDLPALPQSEARRQVIAERERRKELRRALRTGDFERAEKLVKEGRK